VLVSVPRDCGPLRAPRLAPPPEAAARAAAPAFELPLAGGGAASLAAARGEVVLVNFWATWCPPCRRELPALQALEAALGGAGLRILAVSVDRGPTEELASFARARELRFPVLHDRESDVARSYGVGAYPTTVVVDRAGRIALRAAGAYAWDAPESVAWFRALLAEPRPQ
jgi:peroxiredoxin